MSRPVAWLVVFQWSVAQIETSSQKRGLRYYCGQIADRDRVCYGGLNVANDRIRLDDRVSLRLVVEAHPIAPDRTKALVVECGSTHNPKCLIEYPEV